MRIFSLANHALKRFRYTNILTNYSPSLHYTLRIAAVPQAIKVDKNRIQECMIEMLSDMFGKDCIGKMIRGNNISVTVEDKIALVNVETLVSTVTLMYDRDAI